MLDMLGKGNGRLLDIGCGEGSISMKLKEMGYAVVGIDFSQVGVDLARQKGIDARQVDVDGGLPFSDAEYDAVWMGDILEHVFDPIQLLAESRRVINDGGSVYLTTPNDMWILTRIKALFGYSPQSSIYRACRQCKHHSVMSLELLDYFIAEAGLKLGDFHADCQIPKTGIRFYTKSRFVASLFGRVFVVRLSK